MAGPDRLNLFKGAELALLELSTQERFSGTQVAVASSTTEREWALECLRLLQVRVVEGDTHTVRGIVAIVGASGSPDNSHARDMQ